MLICEEFRMSVSRDISIRRRKACKRRKQVRVECAQYVIKEKRGVTSGGIDEYNR